MVNCAGKRSVRSTANPSQRFVPRHASTENQPCRHLTDLPVFLFLPCRGLIRGRARTLRKPIRRVWVRTASRRIRPHRKNQALQRTQLRSGYAPGTSPIAAENLLAERGSDCDSLRHRFMFEKLKTGNGGGLFRTGAERPQTRARARLADGPRCCKSIQAPAARAPTHRFVIDDS